MEEEVFNQIMDKDIIREVSIREASIKGVMDKVMVKDKEVLAKVAMDKVAMDKEEDGCSKTHMTEIRCWLLRLKAFSHDMIKTVQVSLKNTNFKGFLESYACNWIFLLLKVLRSS